MKSNDSLLTNDEFRHLYYGYVFDSKYSAYFSSKNEDRLLKYYQSEKIDEKDYDIVIKSILVNDNKRGCHFLG